jgi:hypothetical protein
MPLSPMAAKALASSWAPGGKDDSSIPAGKTAENLRSQASKEAVQEAAVQPDDVIPYESLKGILKLVLRGALPMGALGMIFKGFGKDLENNPFSWTYSTDALKDFARGIETKTPGKFVGLVDPNTEHMAYASAGTPHHEDLLKELRQQLPDKMRASGEKLPELGDNLAHVRYREGFPKMNYINPNLDAKDMMKTLTSRELNPVRMANVERRNLDKIRSMIESVGAIPKGTPMEEGSFWQHYMK